MSVIDFLWLTVSCVVGDIRPQKFQVNLFSAPSSVILMFILQKASSQSPPLQLTLSYPPSWLFTPVAQGFSHYYLNGPQGPIHWTVGDESFPATIIPSAPSYQLPTCVQGSPHLVLIRKQTSAGFQIPSYFLSISSHGHDDLYQFPWIH